MINMLSKWDDAILSHLEKDIETEEIDFVQKKFHPQYNWDNESFFDQYFVYNPKEKALTLEMEIGRTPRRPSSQKKIKKIKKMKPMVKNKTINQWTPFLASLPCYYLLMLLIRLI